MLRLSGIHQRYGAKEVLALDRFEAAQGEHWLVLGASGSGKTTFLNLVAALLKPSEGEIEVEDLSKRLKRMNPRAPVKKVHFGAAPIEEILDIRGFNLNAILELDPEFLAESHHEHHDEVESFVFRSKKPFNGDKLEQFLSGIIQVYGPDLLRYKGVLWMKGNPRRVVFQGVHMMMGGDMGKPWTKGEKKSSTLVFIGKKLPKDLFLAGLEECLAA